MTCRRQAVMEEMRKVLSFSLLLLPFASVGSSLLLFAAPQITSAVVADRGSDPKHAPRTIESPCYFYDRRARVDRESARSASQEHDGSYPPC